MVRKPISKESLATQLYNNLRSSLMDGQFAPGQRLTISAVAAEYGTSITPVREAIFRLVSEKSLELRAATSVQVPALDVNRLREIRQIRIELEGLAAFRVAETIKPAQLRELKSINEKFITAAASNPAKASVLNRDFHFAILEIAGMPVLEGICENMWVLMGPFLRMFHDRMPKRELSSGNHKHFELLAAIERGDPEESRAAMQEDIRWGEEFLEMLEAGLSPELAAG